MEMEIRNQRNVEYRENLGEREQVKENASMSVPITNDDLSPVEELPYPKHIFFIIGNEFCERFNFYGMRTILYIYMTEKIKLNRSDATVQYHGFSMAVFFTCIIGGIISDVWLGKFWTILSLSIVYVAGSLVLSIGAIPNIEISIDGSLYAGLALIALGSGGIKPCVAAFGGDQFKLPEQIVSMTRFFSVFYLTINLGSLISSGLTPYLRANVHCFNENDCYSLAFAIPAFLMIISIVLFVFGRPWYTMNLPQQGNILMQVGKCIANGIVSKIRFRKLVPRDHFLDYSIGEYGHQLVDDTKLLLNIMVLLIPMPLFWALYDQQGSRWVDQALAMNGNIGFYTILPDQMQMLNPLLIIVLTPLFDFVIYPLLKKIGLRRPLQKITIGGLLAAGSFVISAIVQWQVEMHPNQIHILWQIPQLTVITVAEVMFSITGLSFSYEQSPKSMKSLVQALWLLTSAIGNVIVMVIAEFELFERMVYEYILYSCLMFFDMLIFMFLAYRFKGINSSEQKQRQQ